MESSGQLPMNLNLMMTLHNNKVCIVFTEHTWMVVFFVEVDEHENMSVLLVAHDGPGSNASSASNTARSEVEFELGVDVFVARFRDGTDAYNRKFRAVIVSSTEKPWRAVGLTLAPELALTDAAMPSPATLNMSGSQ